jgi:hypothetical protein
MGNCIKRQSIFSDSYLFEPLSPNSEAIFMEEPHAQKCTCNENKLILESKITELTSKIELLEKNTQQNLKLLSDDIHYINNKANTHTSLRSSHESNTSLNSNESTY